MVWISFYSYFMVWMITIIGKFCSTSFLSFLGTDKRGFFFFFVILISGKSTDYYVFLVIGYFGSY